ncbi:uncharacterized protein LTR77_000918 [Saxophila tyrrhenica]|uniref:Short-chain dehydrogenase/reductase 3 n=1 Tax=Saxophila tyrrhenica TaxID=1690608 RepID=A0AAV9PTX6_9PEZI|nr:hypothetical protein LTR77_000918 [Saxophila tyrrhenica]
MDIIKSAPLSPAFTGALLYSLTKAPDQVKQHALQHLGKYLSPKNITRTITALKWLFALGLTRNVHVFLSNLAQNNFRFRSERRNYDWPNEIAVVTGSSSGFGALISKGLADKGINVMCLDLAEEMPDDMKGNAKLHYYQCDVTNRETVLSVGEQIKREHGEASILINNAGVAYNHHTLDVSEKAIHRLFDVNIISHYWTLQAFLPDMIKNRKGHVVSLASMASFLSPPGLIPYCNTKAAVLSLHDGLQQETRVAYKCPEIKFTSVHPTYAATAMTASWRKELADAKATMLDPTDVANAVVKQVLSGKGAQLIMGAETSFLAGIRGWPHWLAQTIIHATDGQANMAQKGAERTGG